MPASTRGARRSLSCLATIIAIICGMPVSAQSTPPTTEDAEALRAELATGKRRPRTHRDTAARRCRPWCGCGCGRSGG
jgi:hypothetical protein